MERTEIARVFADMEQFGGRTVTVCGWARTIRDMKNFGFIELNDGSCFKNLQVVFDGDLENYKEIAKQNVGAALIVTGTVVLFAGIGALSTGASSKVKESAFPQADRETGGYRMPWKRNLLFNGPSPCFLPEASFVFPRGRDSGSADFQRSEFSAGVPVSFRANR